MEEGEVEDILKSIDEKDLDEDDCFWVFTLVLVERSKVRAQHKNKKRTWKQSKELKRAMAKDRSFFDRRRNQPPNQRPKEVIGTKSARILMSPNQKSSRASSSAHPDEAAVPLFLPISGQT